MVFKIVYEPRMDDPVVVAEFVAQSEAESYMQELKEKRPQTYKYTTIVVDCTSSSAG